MTNLLRTVLVFCALTSVLSIKLEPFKSYAHDLASGPLDFNDTHVTIPNFHYDGTGPEPYFMVGDCTEKYWHERPKPPLKGTRLADETGSTAKLKKYSGKTITLSLPAGKTWKDYDYFAVYCVPYNHNFGYVVINHTILYPGIPVTFIEDPSDNNTNSKPKPQGVLRTCPASAGHSDMRPKSKWSLANLFATAAMILGFKRST